MQKVSQGSNALVTASHGDSAALASIEIQCNPLPWSIKQFEEELSLSYSTTFTINKRESPIGFITVQVLFEVAHIVNLAVLPGYRCKGVGQRLLSRALLKARSHGCTVATLEVRKGNIAARKLYSKFGFGVVGHRPGYYSDNNEDAVIMSLENPEGVGKRSAYF